VANGQIISTPEFDGALWFVTLTNEDDVSAGSGIGLAKDGGAVR
jgi:hypothetical protein